MSLTYVTITETFDDGTGQPLSNVNVTLTPSQTVYAAGVPVVTPAQPIAAQVIGGALKNSAGGPLQLLANIQAGLTLQTGTGFWWWTAAVQIGQITDTWSFQLGTSPASVELYATKGTPAGAIYVPVTGATMQGALDPAVVTLTDAATVAVNAALGNEFDLTLTASGHTIGAPSNPVNGQHIVFRIRQPAAGGPDTVTWAGGAGGYSFGSGVAPTLSTAANACDLIGFDYDAVKGKWLALGSALGF